MPGGNKRGQAPSAVERAHSSDNIGVNPAPVTRIPSTTAIPPSTCTVGAPSDDREDGVVATAFGKGEPSVLLSLTLWAMVVYYMFVMNLHIFVFNESQYNFGLMYFNTIYPVLWLLESLGRRSDRGMVVLGLLLLKGAVLTHLSFTLVVYVCRWGDYVQALVFVAPVGALWVYGRWVEAQSRSGAHDPLADCLAVVLGWVLMGAVITHISCVTTIFFTRSEKLYINTMSAGVIVVSCFLNVFVLCATETLRRCGFQLSEKARWLGCWAVVEGQAPQTEATVWSRSEAPYHLGDVVRHGEVTYVALEEHNVSEPGSGLHGILYAVLEDPELTLAWINLIQVGQTTLILVLVFLNEYTFYSYAAVGLCSFLLCLYTMGLHRIFTSRAAPPLTTAGVAKKAN